jgi:hypothetical protein
VLNASPYGAFAGGVAVAVGDVNGDGVPDLAMVVASGGPAEVKVYNGVTGVLLLDFLAFPAGYTGGASIALGDLDGTGKDDIIVGTTTGVSAVAVFDGRTGALRSEFQAYQGIPIGVRVAAGQLDGTGKAQIVTVPTGMAPVVRVFNGDGTLTGQFFAGNPAFTGGLTVATGDPTGSGRDQILIGADVFGTDYVLAFDGTGNLQSTLKLPVAPSVPPFIGPQMTVVDTNGQRQLRFTVETFLGTFDGSTSAPFVTTILYLGTFGPLYLG